jgi:UrcA family protein
MSLPIHNKPRPTHTGRPTRADRVAGVITVAMLALAALPMAALATKAEAGSARVVVSDLNLNSDEGVAIFHQRDERTARNYCGDRLSLSSRAHCRRSVRAEMTEKLPAVQQAQLQQALRILAAR